MQTTRLPTRVGAALVAAALASGCASRYPGFVSPEADPHHAALRVQNNNWQDVRIYLVREDGGAPQRLGSVSSLASGTIRIPSTTQQFVRLLLRPLGSRASYLTPPIFLEPGRVIQLTVASALTQSSLVLR